MVNIDTVYQRVLALANKEQRGYITPLEFNLLANQAQLDVFEQYFYDRNQTARGPGNSTPFSDVDAMLNEKIAVFEITTPLNNGSLPGNLYRLGAIMTLPDPQNPGIMAEAKNVSSKDWTVISSSPLLQPTNNRPVYVRLNNNIQVFGSNNADIAGIPSAVSVNYIRQPNKVEWGYDVIGEKALFNGAPAKTTHFQHHRSDETELVIKILELAGVIIQDPGIIQYADGENAKQIQQEKQ
tara:strand:+ start:84 stop:800 length:717 start_codon:yes stop_codon:yes gene_type:complete